MLKARILTGSGLTIAFALIFRFSHLPFVLPLTAAVLSLLALRELNQATGFLNGKVAGALAAVWVILLAVLPVPGYKILCSVLFLCVASLFLSIMGHIRTMQRIPAWMSAVMAVSFPIFFRAMAQLRAMEFGLYWLILSVLVGTLTDVGAYLIGKAIGKHRLAPVLSPQKTIEGSIGGTLTCVLVLSIFAGILRRSSILLLPPGPMVLYLLLASLWAQLGDLALSSIKRIVNIKDYGKLLPGHGGILDRFDSMLFVLPFTYLFLSLWSTFC